MDFSAKYGVGYKLKNGCYGVLFNDSTKIVLDANLFHFDYYQRGGAEDKRESHTLFNYPQAINKKVILLQHFKSYLDGNQKFKPITCNFTHESQPQRVLPVEDTVYLKKWKMQKETAIILFRLSNKMIHVLMPAAMGKAEEELVITTNSVTYFNSHTKEVRKAPLNSKIDIIDPIIN